jgi:hypothetical protein
MKLQLNYQVAYDFLINSCKLRGLDKKSLSFKTQKHHIIPKCMGGLDINDNYVLLTLQEHKNAHHLLTLIYPDNTKLKKAYNMMHNQKFGHNKGKKMSEEQKIKISNTLTGVKSSYERLLKQKRKPVKFRGIEYISIREASRLTKVNRQKIKAELGIKIYKNRTHKSDRYLISFNGINYKSLRDAEKQTGINRRKIKIMIDEILYGN